MYGIFGIHDSSDNYTENQNNKEYGGLQDYFEHFGLINDKIIQPLKLCMNLHDFVNKP